MGKSRTTVLLGTTAIAGLMLLSAPADSTDFVYIGPSRGLWSNQSNWSNSLGPPVSGAGTSISFSQARVTYNDLGPFTLSGISLQDRASSAVLTLNGDPLIFDGSPSYASVIGSLVFNTPIKLNTQTLFSSGVSTTFNAPISGQGILQVYGYTANLFSDASHTGGTIVGGVLRVGNGGTVGSLSGDVSVWRWGVLEFARSDTVTFPGVISGEGSVAQSGAGALVLTGDNTYTGATYVNAGVLHIGDGGATGSVTSDMTNQTSLVFNRSSDMTYGGVISGPGSVTKRGPGALTLTGPNTFTGGLTIETGRVAIGAGGGLSAAGGVMLASGTLFDISGAGAVNIGALSGPAGTAVALGGSALTTGSDADNTFGGVIGGAGALVKQGAGTLALTGVNIFTGGLTIEAGRLALSGGGGLAASSPVNVAGAGATFDISASTGNQTIGALLGAGSVALGARTLTFGDATSQTFSGVISGAGGSLVKSGSGTATLTGDSVFTGATRVEAGALYVNGSIAASSGLTVAANATAGGSGVLPTTTVLGRLAPSGGLRVQGDLTLTSGSRVVYQAGVSGDWANPAIGHAVTVSGDLALNGTLDISGPGTSLGYYRLFSYGGTLSGGGLYIDAIPPGWARNNFSIDASRNGFIDLVVVSDGSNTLQTWQGGDGVWGTPPNWRNLGGTLPTQWSGNTAIFNGAGGAIAIDGQQTFQGLQFVTDGYALSSQGPGGELFVGQSGGELRVLAGVSATIDAPISGPGQIAKTGDGLLTLTGFNSYSGGTVISQGVLAVDGPQPLGVGTVTMNGGVLRMAGCGCTPLMNDFAINRAGGTFDAAAGVLELHGRITDGSEGAGSITITGDGVTPGYVIFGGTSSYSGPTHIAGSGILVAGSATGLSLHSDYTVDGVLDLGGFNASLRSLSGAASGRIGSSGAGPVTLTVTGPDDGVFNGRIVDGGDGSVALTKSGAGVLTLTGTSAYTGATRVEAGQLVVNGSIASSSGLTVAAGATVSGSGTLPSTLVLGTLSPGNSPGTITVNGDLTFGAGATYAVEVQGATSDRVNVSGAATLGGSLRITPLGGAYVFNAPYTLLAAQGGRSGVFGEVNVAGSFGDGVGTTVSYTASEVQLTLAPKPLTPIVDPTTPSAPQLGVRGPSNAFAVAAAIDAAVAAGADPSSLFSIYNLPAAAIPAAVNQLSGEVHTAAPGRTRDVGGPTASPADDMAAASPVNPSRYGVWASAFGSRGRTNGDAATGSARRAIEDSHIATGVDLRPDRTTTLGLAVAAGRARASLPGLLGKVEADVFQAGVYAATSIGAVKLGAAASYARLDNDVRRTVPALGAALSSSYATTAWSGRLQASASVLKLGGFSFSPLAAVQATKTSNPGLVEPGWSGPAAALALAPRNGTTSRSEVGVQMDADAIVGGVPVAGFVRAAWAHYFQRDAGLTASLTGLPGATFRTVGAEGGRNSALIVAGIRAKLYENVTVGLNLDGELSAGSARIGGAAQLRIDF